MSAKHQILENYNVPRLICRFVPALYMYRLFTSSREHYIISEYSKVEARGSGFNWPRQCLYKSRHISYHSGNPTVTTWKQAASDVLHCVLKCVHVNIHQQTSTVYSIRSESWGCWQRERRLQMNSCKVCLVLLKEGRNKDQPFVMETIIIAYMCSNHTIIATI